MRHLLLILTCLASAAAHGQTQVPNVFQAGQPASAAEVNANFTELETAANQNAAGIAANSASATQNATDIAANTASAAQNATDIAANTTSTLNNTTSIQQLSGPQGLFVYSQGQPVGRFFSSTSASPLGNSIYLISDTGYLFRTAWSANGGDPYLDQQTYWFSGAGCTGTVYFDVFPDHVASWGGVYRPIRAATEAAWGYYYIPRSSPAVNVTVNSREAAVAGDCLNETSTRDFFLGFPNDEAVTGVPNVQPLQPYTIGAPQG